MFISAKSSWDSSVGVQIPIMAHVNGHIYMPDGTDHPFEHYYNFFHFRPYHDEVQSQSYEVTYLSQGVMTFDFTDLQKQNSKR